MIDTKPLEVHKAFKDRQDNEINLVEENKALLLSAGLHAEVAEHFDTHPFVKEARSMPMQGQRFLLNRFWNLQLLSLNLPTMQERICLVDQGTGSEWLRLFKEGILHTAISQRLPRILQ